MAYHNLSPLNKYLLTNLHNVFLWYIPTLTLMPSSQATIAGDKFITRYVIYYPSTGHWLYHPCLAQSSLSTYPDAGLSSGLSLAFELSTRGTPALVIARPLTYLSVACYHQ